MSFHSFVEYLKYKWAAKGRHGTHSPFVYDLVEQVLQNEGEIDKAYMVKCPDLSLRYENLISRIAAHYQYRSVVRTPVRSEVPAAVDMLLMENVKPGEWTQTLDEYHSLLKRDGAVIVVDIHKTKEHSKEWGVLTKDPRVRMSIDLYGIGMLLFRTEFKMQQHFVLQY